MLTLRDAQKIGVGACIDKLGRSFVEKYRNSATSSYATEADENGMVYCFVGVDDQPPITTRKRSVLTLDSTSQFPYRVSCKVNLQDGRVNLLECVIPA